MEKIANIFWKLLYVITVFLYNIPDEAQAKTRTGSICKKNQYVAACGNHTVGIDWLKGGRIKVSDEDIRTFDDYYDYGSNNQANINNLKTFFRNAGVADEEARQSIVYKTFLGEIETQVADANGLLLATCGDENGKLLSESNIICRDCPNNGITDEASTVDLDYDTYAIMAHTWKFYTIADCYMKNFEDITGTFVYVESQLSQSAESCYYDITKASKTTITGELKANRNPLNSLSFFNLSGYPMFNVSIEDKIYYPV